MKTALVWSPRVIAIAYILFISVFALDSFEGERSFGEKLGGFFIHLLPSVVAAVCLLAAWRFPLVGGLFFMILGMVFTIYFQTDRAFSNFMLISMPLFLAGVLFIFSHPKQAKNGATQ